MLPSNATEQCSTHVLPSNGTDGRNGRTNGEHWSPSSESSPSVTRGRTYEICPDSISPADWQRMSWHARQAATDRQRREERERREAEHAEALRRAAGQRLEPVPHYLHTNDGDWTPQERRAAHAAWTRGERDLWATEGERAYQRARGRQRRAEGRAA